MNQSLLVIKCDGSTEHVNLNKIHRVLDWVAEGLRNVSTSQVELHSHIQFYDDIETSGIHEITIKAAADLISHDAPDYQCLAARPAIFHLRRKTCGQFEPFALYDHVMKMAEMDKYDNHLPEDYTEEELKQMDTFTDHGRDMTFSYTTVKQLEGKYLVQNRVTGETYESIQFLYILIAAYLFSNYLHKTCLQYVKHLHNVVSIFRISLPAPIISGVCTSARQFSSCVLIEYGDNLDSTNTTSSAIAKCASQCVGISISTGHICALGSPIRGDETLYIGCTPFYKHFQTAVKSCSQGGVHDGTAALFYLMWHLEVESLLVLKNSRGVEGNYMRRMGYGVQINKLTYTRLLKDEDITLFSPSDVPRLYNTFFIDQEEFEHLYTKYERDDSIRKQRVRAVKLLSLMMQERAPTGCIYIQNVDHCNTHGPFNPAITSVRRSNLCLEIALPTKPLSNVNDEDGEIALCTLSTSNLGAVNSLDELEELTILAVRVLDALLGYQDYPVLTAKRRVMGRCMLGIGMIDFTHYLAKHGKCYSDGSVNNLTHKIFKVIQYYLLRASNKLAKE